MFEAAAAAAQLGIEATAAAAAQRGIQASRDQLLPRRGQFDARGGAATHKRSCQAAPAAERKSREQDESDEGSDKDDEVTTRAKIRDHPSRLDWTVAAKVLLNQKLQNRSKRYTQDYTQEHLVPGNGVDASVLKSFK